ncbi:MAG: hypothetical protein ACTHMJ_01755 [Thermomicrobiales bacterium]
MAITMTAAAGTDKWADFEDGLYELIFKKMEEDTGQFGPQYKVGFQAADLTDPDSGEAAYFTTWVSQKFNITPGKESNLALMTVALLGRDVAEGEEVNDAALYDRHCMAYIGLNERGWPRIKNNSFAKVRSKTPKAVAKPLPPKAAPKPTGLSAEKQAAVIKAAQDADYDPAGADFSAWLVETFGHGLAELTETEADQVIESLSGGF